MLFSQDHSWLLDKTPSFSGLVVEVREGIVVGVSPIVSGQDMLVKNCYKIFISTFCGKLLTKFALPAKVSVEQNHVCNVGLL